MHNLFKNPKEGQALETPTLAEVINPKSDYFSESFYLTHKVDVNGEKWYRCNPEHYVKGIDSLWFKESELEIEEEDYE